jgi:hypothetical protein
MLRKKTSLTLKLMLKLKPLLGNRCSLRTTSKPVAKIKMIRKKKTVPHKNNYKWNAT